MLILKTLTYIDFITKMLLVIVNIEIGHSQGFSHNKIIYTIPNLLQRGKRKLEDNQKVSDLAQIDVSKVNFTLFGDVKHIVRVLEKQSKRIKKLEEILNILENDELENYADELYVKIVCEGEVDIDTILPSKPKDSQDR